MVRLFPKCQQSSWRPSTSTCSLYWRGPGFLNTRVHVHKEDVSVHECQGHRENVQVHHPHSWSKILQEGKVREPAQLCTNRFKPIVIHEGVLRMLRMFEKPLRKRVSREGELSRRGFKEIAGGVGDPQPRLQALLLPCAVWQAAGILQHRGCGLAPVRAWEKGCTFCSGGALGEPGCGQYPWTQTEHVFCASPNYFFIQSLKSLRTATTLVCIASISLCIM